MMISPKSGFVMFVFNDHLHSDNGVFLETFGLVFGQVYVFSPIQQ